MIIYILERINYQKYFIMEKKNLKKPFFASFLENQLKDTEIVRGGTSSSGVTDKLKDTVTRAQADKEQTMKHPSDGDDITPPVDF